MRSKRQLPARFPDGAKYVLESDGGMVRRYVEFPDGRRVTLARRKAATCYCLDMQTVSIVPAVVEPQPSRKRIAARRVSRTLAHV
jgi:hypothetical protein